MLPFRWTKAVITDTLSWSIKIGFFPSTVAEFYLQTWLDSFPASTMASCQPSLQCNNAMMSCSKVKTCERVCDPTLTKVWKMAELQRIGGWVFKLACVHLPVYCLPDRVTSKPACISVFT